MPGRVGARQPLPAGGRGTAAIAGAAVALVLGASPVLAQPAAVSDPAHAPVGAADAVLRADGTAVVVYGGAGAQGERRIFRRTLSAAGQPADEAVTVDDAAAGGASLPAIAARPGGATAVAWLAGADGETVAALRLFAADATAVTPVLDAAGPAPPGCTDVDVAALAAGGWVVVWSRFAGGDAGREDVVGRICDPGGRFVTGEFLVSGDTAVYNVHPRVVGTSDGAFVVAWGTFSPEQAEVRSRRFLADGIPAGPERTAAPAGSFPALAPGPDGGVALAWTSLAGRAQVALQRLDANGDPVGPRQSLPFAGSSGGRCSLGAAPDGACVVVWPPAGGALDGDLWAAVFTAAGEAVDPPIVLTASPAATGLPSVAALGAGGRALGVWSDGQHGVLARAWTVDALPAASPSWGAWHGLYRSSR